MAVVLAFVLVCTAIYGIVLFNELATLRRQTANAWAQIDIQLRRRYDLIPNLVETVRGAMKYECELFEKLACARTRAVAADTVSGRGAAESDVRTFLGKLVALVEGYPELRANETVLSLQIELKSTEDKIAFARQYYNDAVTRYNTRLETLPSGWVARLSGFRPEELFLIEEAVERENVVVRF